MENKLTTPEQRVEEALYLARLVIPEAEAIVYGGPVAHVLADEVDRLRAEERKTMETFAHEMALKQGEIDALKEQVRIMRKNAMIAPTVTEGQAGIYRCILCGCYGPHFCTGANITAATDPNRGYLP